MKPTGLIITNILLFVAVAVLTYYCFVIDKHETLISPNTENAIIIRDTIVDTIYVRKTTYMPVVNSKDEIRFKSLKGIKDTTILLDDCFIYNVVIDTVVDDSVARFIITDTLFMNRIISRSPEISYFVRNIRTKIFTPISIRPGFYGGIIVCGNMNRFGIGVSGSYVTPGKSNVGISYDFINKQIFVSYSWYLF